MKALKGILPGGEALRVLVMPQCCLLYLGCWVFGGE